MKSSSPGTPRIDRTDEPGPSVESGRDGGDRTANVPSDASRATDQGPFDDSADRSSGEAGDGSARRSADVRELPLQGAGRRDRLDGAENYGRLFGASESNENDAPHRLLRAAGPVFADKGFDRATLREIASEAGTNVAAISYHFGDKMGLYRALIRAIKASCESQYPLPPDDLPPAVEGRIREPLGPAFLAQSEELLRPMVAILLRRMLRGDSKGWQHQLMMREMQQPTAVFPEIVNEYFRPLFEQLRERFRFLLGDSTSDAKLHQMCLSVVGQCLYYRIASDVLLVLFDPEQHAEVTRAETLIDHITNVTVAAVESHRRRDSLPP